MKEKKNENILSFEDELKRKRISELRKEVGDRGRATQKAKRETEKRRLSYIKRVPEWLKLLRAGEMDIEQVPLEFDLRTKIYRKLEEERAGKSKLSMFDDIVEKFKQLEDYGGRKPWGDDD